MNSAQSQAAPKSVRGRGVQPDAMPELVAEARTAAGKGEARRLRSTGKIPAVAYGRGLVSSLISVGPKEVLAILKSERGQNNVIQIQIGGEKLLVMIRDYSYHPVKRDLEHVDFIQVKLDEPVDVEVPLVYTGKPIGVTTGGVIRQVYRTVPVRAVPDRIPLKLEIDIAHLKMNEAVSTQELKLSEGVIVLLPPEQTLIAIVAPEKEKEETPVEPVPGAPGAVPAAGAAAGATPAAGAAGAEGAKDGKDAKAAAPAKDAKEDKKKK